MPLNPQTSFGDGQFGGGQQNPDFDDSLDTFGRVRAKNLLPGETQPGAALEYARPFFRCRIWWDGDAQTPHSYTDKDEGAAAPLAEERVVHWGDIVRQAKGVATFDSARIVLHDIPDAGGARVSDEFGAANPPEGTKVEIDVRLIDATPAWDPGVYETLFSGRIVEVAYQDALTIEFVLSSRNEVLDRALLEPVTKADWPGAPPESLGRYLPIVYGALVENVEGVIVDANLSAVLAASLTSTATSVSLEEDPGLPASGEVRIDTERMTYAGITPGTPATLTGVVRGTSGTVATDHPSGSTVLEVGAITYALALHDVLGITNVRLVDKSGSIRQVPVGITVTPNLAGPATVTLSEQPVLGSVGSSAETVFKFIDLDAVDLPTSGTNNTSSGFTEGEVEAFVGRADGFTDTNYLALSPTDPTRSKAAGRRDLGITIPPGATINRAYVVVEHYLEGAGDVTNTLSGSLDASSTADILLDASVAGFVLSNGTVFVGEERIDYLTATDIPSPRLTGITRGVNTVGGQSHPAGSLVVQSALLVSVRDPAAGASQAIAPADAEGFARRKDPPPLTVSESLGLSTISHGFEDDHTHLVAGDHTHDTDTEHGHMAPTFVGFTPGVLQIREVSSPGGGCTPAKNVRHSELQFASGPANNALDGDASTFGPWIYLATTQPWSGYYGRITANDLQASDDRTVTTVEATFTVSKNGSTTAGTVTVLWADLGGFCGFQQNISASSVGGPRLNIGTLNAASFIGDYGTVGGSVYSLLMSPLASPAFFNSNPNDLVVYSFSDDVTGQGLRVQDFVDEDFGGAGPNNAWVFWKTPNLDVHAITFRLEVESSTSLEVIEDPLDTVDWPDTDTASALKQSTLSFFDLSPKVSAASDLVGRAVQVRHTQQPPHTSEAKILRVFYALELANVVLAGDSEAPSRLIADVSSFNGSGLGFLTFVVSNPDLMGLDANNIIDTPTWLGFEPLLRPIVGALYDQRTAADLFNQVAEESMVMAFWSTEGKLSGQYKAVRSVIDTLAPEVEFQDADLVRSAAGAIRHRAPLSDLINKATVRGRWDAAAGGFTLTAEAEGATSQAAYGLVSPFEFDAELLADQLSLTLLANHLIDYGKDIKPRVTWRAHFNDKALEVDLGSFVGLATSTYQSDDLIVERIVISPGEGRTGRLPYVEFTGLDMAI